MLDDFKIGYWQNEPKTTGVTVILAEQGAVAGYNVMGGAPATRETDLLKSENTVEKINSLVLSGGSAFGLNACDGVAQYLKENDFGFEVNSRRVPIVVGASIYDLDYSNGEYPSNNSGYDACKKAEICNFKNGSFGAGTGATVGKILGFERANKSGQGISTFTFKNGVEIAAISVVNAFGDIIKKDATILKGIKDSKISTESILLNSMNDSSIENLDKELMVKNTTITCLLTNAVLNKTEANRLARVCHDAYARSINPVHTSYDGDAIFVLSSNRIKTSFLSLQIASTKAIERAIRRSVL